MSEVTAVGTGQRRRTDLFLVRVWSEEVRDGSARDGIRWYGKVQRTVDGEVHTFDGWPALLEVLQMMLQVPHASSPRR